MIGEMNILAKEKMTVPGTSLFSLQTGEDFQDVDVIGIQINIEGGWGRGQ